MKNLLIVVILIVIAAAMVAYIGTRKPKRVVAPPQRVAMIDEKRGICERGETDGDFVDSNKDGRVDCVHSSIGAHLFLTTTRGEAIENWKGYLQYLIETKPGIAEAFGGKEKAKAAITICGDEVFLSKSKSCSESNTDRMPYPLGYPYWRSRSSDTGRHFQAEFEKWKKDHPQ